ncbi:MAG: glucans biosynthesis glucosyltransferase MdoH [Flavobacteriaceae bacterium]
MDRIVRLETQADAGLQPPPAPLAMPDQNFRHAPRPLEKLNAPVVFWQRFLIATATALATAIGLYQMIKVVSLGGVTTLEALFVLLFVLTFAWVVFSAVSAIAGLFAGRRVQAGESLAGGGKVALVMPVYNEDPQRVCAALEAMGHGLAAAGQGQRFEIFILSDTRSADILARETQAAMRLSRALGAELAVWYRHRPLNTGKKAGNVREFLERWGGRYEMMVVLDADSLMTPETLIALVRRMDGDPRLGILQSVPALIGARTLFARLQQFAGSLYGPLIARGYGLWQGNDGNYWGHNAAIRCLAFAESCGLPELSRRRPFGGHVLSHDFVEAALIRRAGWKVAMASDLDGSFEAAPPSLSDIAIRDRRWAQGNIQHSRIIGAAGLHPASRLHFAIGILSYASAVLWLVLIIIGALLAAQAILVRPEYFSDEFQLFPTWPRFDSERMLAVFVVSMGVLFLPKILSLLIALFDGSRRRAFGGTAPLIAGFIVEVVLSALYAPVLMLIQCRHIWDILRGRDSGWNAQRRDEGETRWGEAVRHHRMHMMAGVVGAAAALLLAPPLAAWLAPVTVGLIISIPLSRWSGSRRAGKLFTRGGFLLSPAEIDPPAIARERDALLESYASGYEGDVLDQLATDPSARHEHFAALGKPAPMPRGRPDTPRLTAARKIVEATDLEELRAWLTPEERMAIVRDPALVDLMQPLLGGAPSRTAENAVAGFTGAAGAAE